MTYEEKIIEHYSDGYEDLVKDYIEALKELLKKYEREEYRNCPLCSVGYPCAHCPWHVLVGGGCVEMVLVVRFGNPEGRKRQIKRWINAYERAWEEIK